MKIAIQIVFLLMIQMTAKAGLMLEPYLGYDFGQMDYQFKSGTRQLTDKTTNTALGARLGYKFLIPWIAVDFNLGSGKNTADSNSGQQDQDFSKTSLGVVVGADLIMGLRIFGGYGFTNEMKLKGVNNAADEKYTGSYTKGGLGYKIIPMLAVNAEYIMHKFAKYDNGTTNRDMDAVYKSFDYNTVLISLSVPFSL